MRKKNARLKQSEARVFKIRVRPNNRFQRTALTRRR